MMRSKRAEIEKAAMRVVEECGELLQCVGKGERFGWDNFHPDRPTTTNLEELEIELEDLNMAVGALKNLIRS